MPKAIVNSSSSFFLQSGWAPVSLLPKRGAVIGVDRAGRPKYEVVEIDRTNKFEASCFVGSRAAFGTFHPLSPLLDSAGNRRKVEELVNQETFDDMQFETLVDPPMDLDAPESLSNFWLQLAGSALMTRGNTYVFKRNSADPAHLPEWKAFTSRGVSHAFVDVGAAMRTLGQGSAREEILRFLFCNTKGAIDFDRSAYVLAMWYTLLRKRRGSSYRFNYDSLQHTALISVDESQTCFVVERVRTAFRAGRSETVTIHWADQTWNPVSSGFILAGA